MREILLNICMTAIALCLFKMLIPDNSMKKQADFLISCFFLASMLFFFTSGRMDFAKGADFSQETIPYINFDEEYAKAQRNAIGNEMRLKIMNVLADEGIYPEEIYVIVNISGKQSISINEIRLVFLKQTDSEEFEESEEEIEILREAVRITRKEVGRDITVTGEFK